MKSLPFSAILLTCLLAAIVQKATADERPNFIFFLSDDISQDDFGCYGHKTIKTPNVDWLAANGMRFDNAYLTTSSCSPSRCSMISGRYPHNTGAPELMQRLGTDPIRFPELLRRAGYYTELAGKNHMFGAPDRAFDEMGPGGKPGGESYWVEKVQNRPKDKPFFFWFSSNDAHRGFLISGDSPRYTPEDAVIPPYMVDTKLTRKDFSAYYHEVSRFDHYVGLVRDELKKQGVLDNTFIVVGSDNGRPFPRCKTRLYDSGIKTPWVVHFPKLIKAPTVTKSLISVIDLAPTCLELAGVEPLACFQGRSFVPILKDPEATIRDMVFTEHNWHVYQAHERMVRFGDYVYIKNNYPHLPNLSRESVKYTSAKELWKAHAAGKTTPAQQQIFAMPCPEEELFLLTKDPHQLANLAENPEHRAALEKGRKMIEAWTRLTGDTIPENPTRSSDSPPKIVNGVLVNQKGLGDNRGEWPGQSSNADKINHPGPIRFADVEGVQD